MDKSRNKEKRSGGENTFWFLLHFQITPLKNTHLIKLSQNNLLFRHRRRTSSILHNRNYDRSYWLHEEFFLLKWMGKWISTVNFIWCLKFRGLEEFLSYKTLLIIIIPRIQESLLFFSKCSWLNNCHNLAA